MNILVQSPYYNEEKLLPFFLNYYNFLINKLGGGKIVLFDFGSTDNSKIIIQNFKRHNNVEIENIQMHTNQHREDLLMCIRNGYWKVFKNNYDYIFVVDIDEIIYHKNIISLLQSKKYNIFRCKGFDVSLPDIPKPEYTLDNLLQICKNLWEKKALNKVTIFNPKHDINYDWGCHSESISGKYNLNDKEIYLYQFRFLGYEYFKFINNEKYKRRDKSNGFGKHYDKNKDLTEIDYNKWINERFNYIDKN